MLNETRKTLRQMVIDRARECTEKGESRYGLGSRVVPVDEEIAYRLRHQDHFGLNTKCTAEVMGISGRTVRRLLRRLNKRAKQLFPVLRPRSAKIYSLFVNDNMTAVEIADDLGVSVWTVYRALNYMYSHRHRLGLYFMSGTRNRLQYKPFMDKYVREKW